MITMQDIADEAGVSKGTVSYVLNGKQEKARINQETCSKVIAIAEKLGYRRNAIAQSMKTGKTNVIGVIGGLYSGYCMEIIKGINDVASKNNYMIKLLPIELLDDQNVMNVARQCVEQRLAGVICRSIPENGLKILHNELKPNNISMVLVDSSFHHNWCSRVICDDFEGAKMATEYLISQGHRRIGHITNSLTRGFAKIRYDGYIEAIKSINDFVDHENILEVSDDVYSISNVFRNEVSNYIRKFQPSAIFCGSDMIAMKTMNIISELELHITRDISIIGYGGLDFSALANPALTTVAQDFSGMGRKAAEVLFNNLKGNQKIKQIKIPVKLLMRNSVGNIK